MWNHFPLCKKTAKGPSCVPWPEVTDEVPAVSISKVVITLPEPSFDRRGLLSFKITFDGLNIQ